ncbi:saccharopine dehydrogenase NADP-binding domain-containing protein, partial [Candidatus Woesearchaeota archaeon]|nr:saccharopine dehydrogenase NADP-binding domain-containing protein [Candidatus Woesearchaeota archaeon]
MRYVVLGGTGAMGRFVVRDLFETAKNAEIVVAARDFAEVQKYVASFKSKRVMGKKIDLTNIEQTAEVLRGATVCINCTNYYYNLHAMKACLLAKCHYVDLGGLYHMTRKQLQFHNTFRKKDLLAILGCGSTPGITNVMISHAAQQFSKINSIHIRFGGHDWTKYKQHFVLPYTAYTLFDEFTDQPVIFDHGRLKFVEPMSDQDTYTFPKPVGKKVCFYTLHSELATIPDTYQRKGLKECSFRVCFPEDFVHDVKLLIELGMADNKPMQIGKMQVIPREVTAKELNRVALPKNVKVKDIELIWVDVEGTRKGK